MRDIYMQKQDVLIFGGGYLMHAPNWFAMQSLAFP